MPRRFDFCDFEIERRQFEQQQGDRQFLAGRVAPPPRHRRSTSAEQPAQSIEHIRACSPPLWSLRRRSFCAQRKEGGAV